MRPFVKLLWPNVIIVITIIIRSHQSDSYRYRPIDTNGVSLSLSVCLLVTFVSPAKTAVPVEMPFGADIAWTQQPYIRWGNLGVVRPIEKHCKYVSFFLFGSLCCCVHKNGWTDRHAVFGPSHAGPKKCVLHGSQGRTNHLPLRWVTGWRCGLSSRFFDHLLLLLEQTYKPSHLQMQTPIRTFLQNAKNSSFVTKPSPKTNKTAELNDWTRYSWQTVK